LRRPQRPHDVQLFDPAFRLPPPGTSNSKPRGVSFRAREDDIERQRSLRSSFINKEKPGEKLVKRVLASEGLGR
jgi:hypothetical protein